MPRPLPRPSKGLLLTGLGMLLLGGCHYASSPLVGFGPFIGQTHSFAVNPNLPPGRDENLLSSEGRAVALEPLLPQGGNVWPGPPPPIPTLSDIEKQQNQFDQQGTPPPGVPPLAPLPQEPVPVAPPSRFAPLAVPPAAAPPRAPSIATPGGPLINNGPIGVPGGASTATSPTGGTSIVVPNGNGTSTVIGPDGSTTTVPTPK